MDTGCLDAKDLNRMATLAFTLIGLALLGGVVAGGVAGWPSVRSLGLGPAFLVYLGLLAIVSTTFAQSMEILPVTLLYGVVTGIVPFALAFYGMRWLVRSKLAPRLGASKAPPDKQSQRSDR
jgi:hypothetical protein